MFEYYTFVPWCAYAFTTAYRDTYLHHVLKLKAWLAASVWMRQARLTSPASRVQPALTSFVHRVFIASPAVSSTRWQQKQSHLARWNYSTALWYTRVTKRQPDGVHTSSCHARCTPSHACIRACTNLAYEVKHAYI